MAIDKHSAQAHHWTLFENINQSLRSHHFNWLVLRKWQTTTWNDCRYSNWTIYVMLPWQPYRTKYSRVRLNNSQLAAFGSLE